jgi:hypothetical protein
MPLYSMPGTLKLSSSIASSNRMMPLTEVTRNGIVRTISSMSYQSSVISSTKAAYPKPNANDT